MLEVRSDIHQRCEFDPQPRCPPIHCLLHIIRDDELTIATWIIQTNWCCR